MKYLEGTPVALETSVLRSQIGESVAYLRHGDIDHARGSAGAPRVACIRGIERRHIEFDNGDWVAFSQIAELIRLAPEAGSAARKQVGE